MKPTPQQTAELTNYLKKELKFRESFEEIYDHILSALEHKADDANFQDTVNAIIKEDFGGHNRLPEIEKRIATSIADDCRRKFRGFFVDQLKAPSIFYYLPIGAALYFILDALQLAPKAVQVVFVLIMFCPSFLALFRYFKGGYAFEDRSASARDKVFGFTTWLPLWLTGGLILWMPKLDVYFIAHAIWGSGSYVLPAILLTLAMMYNVAVYKLYSDEFKFAK
ncbi:hypothetical protein D0C36_07470 [Mucilaginibacter conchicola]|uniref:Uncharacterized protein n=1 Tax=Mucilaginibacter conchicola TaxID=2303333 RepID=A0A372P0C0_9SPHI|nr:hypothetical protein [Mucilaginibacter conchicola]RFZ95359.1 hypothetical protein D0C36_07470 [Mucilaginibacter conchicola]